MAETYDRPGQGSTVASNQHAPSGGRTTAEAVADPERLTALRGAGLLDTPPEPAFDRLTRLAQRLLDAPVVLMSLVDADRQVFKSAQGLKEPWASRRETPLSHSFCQHVVGSGDVFAVEDAREHPLVCDSRAIAELEVVAYLGVPLLTADGQVLGSLCAIDNRSRSWTRQNLADLSDLAAVMAIEVAARRHLHAREEDHRQANLLVEELDHRIRNLLSLVQAVARQTGVDADSVKDFLDAFCGRLGGLARAHATLMQSRWQAAGLREIANGALQAHLGDGRLQLDLPAGQLDPTRAVSMALILHELATNAVKHGALSRPAGRVRLSGRASDQHIVLIWQELGGPRVQRPKRQGFGTRLLDATMAQHGGAVELDWPSEGLVCRLHLPLAEQASSGGDAPSSAGRPDAT